MRNWGRLSAVWGSPILLGVALGSVVLPGCSDDTRIEEPNFVPPGTEGEPAGLIVTPRTLPPVGAGATIRLAGGGEIHTIVIDGRPFVPIELTFSERSWQAIVGRAGFAGAEKAERDALVKNELETVLSEIGKYAKVVGADLLTSVGWASAFVPLEAYESLGSISSIGQAMLVNPVVSTPMERAERDLRTDEELGFAASGSVSKLEDLVGLSRMGVEEFIADAQQDLAGYKPDGSHVTIGIVDTGITFNHPAFKDRAGASRIESMKDFTGEGRIFFTAAGRFEITPGPATPPSGAQASETLTLTADFLAPPKSAYESPDPSVLDKIENETILVPPALRALLEVPGASGARFGVLDEVAFGTKSRSIDLDQNGKMNDRFYAILVPGQNGEPDAVWVALAGKGDFRRSTRLTNFDLAHETQAVYAERFGFHIKQEMILDGTGGNVPVTTAAIVGFDPGNHGSHVAGIAAARKILANDPEDTKIHGVAPLARLASGRVCANTGGCRATKAIADLSEAGAHVINMSIGSLGADNDGYGVQEAVIDRLTVQNGTVFVVAASNDGPGRQTVGSPSTARFSISVAATASPGIIQAQYSYPGSGKASNAVLDDYLLYFSSRGPTSAGGMKPDISAPGTWLSAVQLNASPGAASGLNVMWGTSMASPATAGAVALLLDAAKVYNAIHTQDPLATDARTIRRVLLASARPFDVTTLDTSTQQTTQGQYTWIDQGFGMVNLQRAWQLLKAERVARRDTAVHFTENGVVREVPLDYQVRVLRKNPNGLAYDGSQSIKGTGDAPEAKFGRGLWLDAKSTESLYRVQIARRLPSDVVTRPDVGDLAMQLRTTADEFELETTIHGSHLNWVKAGVLNGLDCASSTVAPSTTPPRVLVVGEGAFDVPVNPDTGKGGSVAHATSVMHVCVNRALVDALPPGDHGAIVTAYRVVGNQREAVPSFVVPVYVTIPHKTLAGPEGLHVGGTVDSFGVARHYVEVPKGTTIVKVTLDVPPATQTGTAVSGCSGVSLEALEGSNTSIPPEFQKSPGDAIAQNCTSQGKLAPADWRRVSIVRPAPKSGIWDLHLFGMYAFNSSAYTLDVAFAKVESTKTVLDGDFNVLANTFDVEVVDASYQLVLSNEKSSFALTGFSREQSAQVAEKTKLRVPDPAGAIGRSYAADVATVTIATRSTGNDLDLEILECDDAALEVCKRVARSAGPTDTEKATFTPKAGKLYIAEVEGFAIKQNGGAFTLREELQRDKSERGMLSFSQPSPKLFSVSTAFDVAMSPILNDPRYTTGGYSVEGAVDVKDDAGTLIVRIPVHVHP